MRPLQLTRVKFKRKLGKFGYLDMEVKEDLTAQGMNIRDAVDNSNRKS